MSLTPLDIHHKEFQRSFRGYAEADVDAFLDQVVIEFEELLQENEALRQRIDELEDQVRHFEELEQTLHNTLVVAQETADDVRQSAKQEADLTLKEAQQQAEKMIDEAESEIEDSRRMYEQMQAEMRRFRSKMKGMLKTHLELLDEMQTGPFEVPSLTGLSETAAAADGSESDGAAE